MTNIGLLKEGDEQAIKEVYEENRNAFFLFLKKYGLTDDEVRDIYQDSVIALIENAAKGRMDALKSSVSTYLLAIGKYKAIRHLKTAKANTEIDALPEGLEWNELEEEQKNEAVQQLRNGLLQLGERCRAILTLFYYRQLKSEEVMQRLGYTNRDVFKSQKSRCLAQLKGLMKK